MTKTLLEIAELANVNKMRVYRYIKKHNIVTQECNGVLQINDTVANRIIKELLNDNRNMNHNTERNSVTVDVTPDVTLVTISEMVHLLKKELESKENQLTIKDKQINDLNGLLAKEQQLNEHNQILLKQSQQQNQILLIDAKMEVTSDLKRPNEVNQEKDTSELEMKEQTLKDEIHQLENRQEELLQQQAEIVQQIEPIKLDDLEFKESGLFGSKTVKMAPDSFEKVLSLAKVSESFKTQNKVIMSENKYLHEDNERLYQDNESLKVYVADLLEQKKESNRQIDLWRNLVHWIQDNVPGAKKYLKKYERDQNKSNRLK